MSIKKTIPQLDPLLPENSIADGDIFYAVIGGHDYAVQFNRITSIPAFIAALAAKADLDNGKIPASQLPSYVDDVLEYSTATAFPVPGETGKIYVANDTNKVYRWSGSSYVEIAASLALGETSSTAYRGDRGKAAYEHSLLTGNAHGMTAIQAGALIDSYNASREITISGGIANIDCSVGCSAYIRTGSSFSIDIRNVKNGMVGTLLIDITSTITIIINNVTDFYMNSFTKLITGTFSSLPLGMYNVGYSVVDLGSGKRFISLNIQKYR